MAKARIFEEDLAGVTLAVIAHAALFAALVYAPRPLPVEPPKGVTVSLVGDIAEQAGSPSREQAQAATAPQIAPNPVPEPAPAPAPMPLPQPVPKIAPAPVPKLAPTPPKPAPQKAVSPTRPTPVQPARPLAAPGKAGGASKVGPDFLKGMGQASKGVAGPPPGPTVTPQVRVSLAQAVLRQVRPKWQGRVPQGLNSEKLVSILSVELNPDGSLARRPTLLGQEGVDDTNRAQAQRHAEEAIRAVQLSAPFQLPPELYDGWKKLPPLRFRKSTSP